MSLRLWHWRFQNNVEISAPERIGFIERDQVVQIGKLFPLHQETLQAVVCVGLGVNPAVMLFSISPASRETATKSSLLHLHRQASIDWLIDYSNFNNEFGWSFDWLIYWLIRFQWRVWVDFWLIDLLIDQISMTSLGGLSIDWFIDWSGIQ